MGWCMCACIHTHTHTHTHGVFHTEASWHMSFILSLTSNPGRFEGFCSFCWPVLKLLGSNNQLHFHNSKITVGYFLPAAAKLLQSCPTLCDPMDGSPPGSAVPGILQARTLEWVAISFSGAWKWKVKGKSLSCVQLLATPWTAAYQAPPSMGFARQFSSYSKPDTVLSTLHALSRYPPLSMNAQSFSRVRLFVTPWTVAHQPPPSVGIPRQECWTGLPFPLQESSQPRN